MDTFSAGHWVLLVIFIFLIALTVAVTLFIKDPDYSDLFDNLSRTSTDDRINTLFNRPKEFYIIAHRGAKSDYPENTMPAFKGALEAGADMIELDVRLSKDGIPVVIHDKKVGRTTDGRGEVWQMKVDELKRLDAGSWFAKRFADARIPTLEEVLVWAKDNIPLNIELKPLSRRVAVHGGLEEKTVNLVKQFEMEDQVFFSSFYYEAIKHIRIMNPEISTGLLYNWRISGNLLPSELVSRYGVDAFHCSKEELNRRWIQNMKLRDIPFLVYTVNRKRAMKRIYQQGARGIFTNKPALLKEVVEPLTR